MVSQAHDSPAGWDPGPEKKRELFYSSLEEFVTGYFAPMMRRRLGGHLTWCPQWWQHAEALGRLSALWSTWEYYRLEGATGLSEWFLHHCDPHLAVLMSRDNGPFMSCKKDEHGDLDPLPCQPAPEGRLDRPEFREPGTPAVPGTS